MGKMFQKMVGLTLMISLLAGLLIGCAGEKKATTNEDTTELIWYYVGDSTAEDQEIFDAANKIIKEKINATVNFMPIAMGDYGQKMQLKSSASEVFDLCFTADWGGYLYYDNVKKGAFMAIDDLIEKKAPKLKEMIPENIWKGVSVAGKTYAVPNYQVSFRQPAYIFKKELVEKYNLQDALDNAKTMEDFTPILKVVQENEPNIIPAGKGPTSNMHMIGSLDDYYEKPVQVASIGVDYDLNVLDMRKGKPAEEYMKMLALSHEWNKLGFYHKDVGIAKDFTPELKAGKIFMTTDTYKPGLEADMELRYGYPVYIKILGNPIISTGSISAALTAVSRTSKNPEKAMEFLELINSDKELYNLIVFGIEGTQYKKTGPNSIEIFSEAKYRAHAWAMGCQFNAYTLPGQPDDVWEQTIICNEEAYPSPLLGFCFDNENIKTELANLQTASAPYDALIMWGLTDDYETLVKDADAQTDKDVQVIKEEIERQIEEFKKTKN